MCVCVCALAHRQLFVARSRHTHTHCELRAHAHTQTHTRSFGHSLAGALTLTHYLLSLRTHTRTQGLIPPTVESLEQQVARALEQMKSFELPIHQYIYLNSLQRTNQTLFYALLAANLEQCLPIVYTPTGACVCVSGSGCLSLCVSMDMISKIYGRPTFLGLCMCVCACVRKGNSR